MPLQAKLLRVIQDGVVRRVGSEQQDAVVDVRFISATNREPQEAVDSGVLRDDLFYRLRVVPIKLPPLRKRPEDIPLLANHFLTYYWAAAPPDGRPGAAPERGEHRASCARARGAATCASSRTSSSTSPCWPSPISSSSRTTSRSTTTAASGRPTRAVSSGGHGRGLSRREGPGRRAVREGIPHPARGPRRRQHVQGRPSREHRPHHALPAHGQARLPPRREHRGRSSESGNRRVRRRPAASAGGTSPAAAPVRVWDPDGPSGGPVAPALWDALREAVLWAQARVGARGRACRGRWTRSRCISPSSARPSAQQASGQDADLGALPRNALSRRLARASSGAAFVERAAGAARARRRPAAPAPRRHRAGGPAARGRLVAALRRPAVRARRARARRRGGPRPPLAAHLDPLPRRDAAAGPERPGQRRCRSGSSASSTAPPSA